MSIRLDKEKIEIFEKTIAIMAEFKHVIGRELKPDVIAEIYVARELNLELMDGPNAPGYDAIDSSGKRYEI